MDQRPVVIVGGGVAGLSTAKVLSKAGVRCLIVEREASLGGHVRNWACMATDRCQRCFCCVVEDLIKATEASDLVQVMTGRGLALVIPSAQGMQVTLRERSTGNELPVETPVVVAATGFEPYDPGEKVLWGHNRLKGVYTLAEVDALLRGDRIDGLTDGAEKLRVAFFQCVGSRDAVSGANYCSIYCCTAALRMALKLVHECPGVQPTIYYIDLQVANKYSGELLKQIKEKNVQLRQGVPGEIVTSTENSLEVIVEHDGKNVRECFDRIVLSIGQRPRSETSSLAQTLGLVINDFGFLEPKSLLDSGRTATPGIYLAGTCSGPMDIEQTIEHAGQTAQAILADLRAGRVR